MGSKKQTGSDQGMAASSGESGGTQTAVGETQPNGEASQQRTVKRKKQKGPRTVFYLAVVTDTSNGRATEVARADTKNQLDKKLSILVEAGYATDGVWEILQCRSL